jgi:hypothetical protein
VTPCPARVRIVNARAADADASDASSDASIVMATLDDLYAVSRRLCFDVAEGVGRLERDERAGANAPRSESLARELRNRVSELRRITSEMERQWRAMAMTASISKSDTWKVRRARRWRARAEGGSRAAPTRAPLGAPRERARGGRRRLTTRDGMENENREK